MIVSRSAICYSVEYRSVLIFVIPCDCTSFIDGSSLRCLFGVTAKEIERPLDLFRENESRDSVIYGSLQLSELVRAARGNTYLLKNGFQQWTSF